MKVAILSDIHSNLEALTACRDRALALGVERFVCLGDCVGYGPDPAATMDLLISLPGLIAVLGNHDEHVMVEGGSLPSPQVKQAVDWTRRQLQREHLEFLGGLPYLHIENGVTYVHASAARPYEWVYLLVAEQARECMEAAETPLVFVGHVHIPALYRQTRLGTAEPVELEQDRIYALNPSQHYVVNVGSVGQPRDDDNRASFVIYDEAQNSVTFQRVPYDYAATGRKIQAAGLHPFFAERLASGR
jgi:diadenosine tetraphosphatase ApaH/serine/threonine PP2A family protein phosphatase